MQPNPALCPERLRISLDNYGAHSVPVGGFLQAVLENDLRKTLAYADPASIELLPHIMAYVSFALPLSSWGSPADVAEWLKKDVVVTT